MIDVAPFLKIAPIFLVALASPGPDFMLISSLAMSRGRTAGILGAAGIAFGVLIYVALCVFGLGFIIARAHWLLIAIKAAGGLYLMYLGYQLWKASLKKPGQNQSTTSAKKKNPFVLGLLTNMTNPKALAFFTSVFAFILTPETGLGTQISVIFFMGLMTLAWFSFVTLGLSAAPVRAMYLRWSKWIDRVAGTFLAFFGLRLIWSARN